MRRFRSVAFTLVLTGAVGCGSQAGSPGGGASGKNVNIPGPGYEEDDVGEGINARDFNGMEPAGAPSLGPDIVCTGAPFSKEVFPGDTNTMVAALSARQALSEGRSPLPSSVRAQDFFNYYGMDLGSNTDVPGVPKLVVEAVQRNIPGRWEVAVAIQAAPVTTDKRKPLMLTVVVDLTPSMWGLGLSRVQESLAAIASNLKAGDKLQLVTTRPDDVAQTFQIQGANDPQLIEATDALAIENDGDLVVALQNGYEAARDNASPEAWNRVLVLSAGNAPEDQLPAALISGAANEEGIFLVAGATGSSYGEFQRFLSGASRLGRGPYVYLGVQDSPSELFGARFAEIFGFGIDQIKLTLDLPGHARLLTESPSAPTVTAESVAQYIGPGAAQLFLFRVTTCTQPPATDAVGVKVDYVDQNGQPGQVQAKALFSEWDLAPRPVYAKTAAIVAYVDALRSMDSMRIGFAQDAIANALPLVGPADQDELTSIGALLDLHPAK
jgi:hypothetical protein